MIELSVTPAEAAGILRRTHAIEAESLTPLGSELASTFLVSTATGRLAVKLQGSSSDEAPVQRWRADVAHRLSDRGQPVPALIRAANGDAIAATTHRGAPVQVLAMEWIEAAPYGTIDVPPGFGVALGHAAAHLQRDLLDMPRPPREIVHTWDSRHTARVIAEHLSRIDDGEVVAIGEAALALHERDISPVSHLLPVALVHQDLHDSNVLATPSGEVAGIIDFDDMLVGWRVAEPAIAAGYLARGSTDPVRALQSVAEGWESEVPFTDAERRAFPAIATVRLALNTVVWHARMQSDRGAYAGARSRGSLAAFRVLADWLGA